MDAACYDLQFDDGINAAPGADGSVVFSWRTPA